MCEMEKVGGVFTLVREGSGEEGARGDVRRVDGCGWVFLVNKIPRNP